MEKAILETRRTLGARQRVHMRKHVKKDLLIPRKAVSGWRSDSVLDTNSCAHDIRILLLAFSTCCGSHYPHT